MPSSEEYRHSAEECRRLAETAEDEVERGTLLQLADQWYRLAEHKARVEARQRLP